MLFHILQCDFRFVQRLSKSVFELSILLWRDKVDELLLLYVVEELARGDGLKGDFNGCHFRFRFRFSLYIGKYIVLENK
jgi:hypothetical protein